MRYNGLDAWRGLACIGMLVFHIEAIRIFVMRTYSTWLFDWPGVFLGQFVRISFLLLVGVSTWIIYNKKKDYLAFMKKQSVRFIKVGVVAGLVSLVSYLVAPEFFIVFGILHLIAVANLLVFGFSYLPRLINFILGLLFICLGYMETSISLGKLIDFLLGQPYRGFTSFDYFPLIPWFGYVLIGFSLGSVLVRCVSNFQLNDSNPLVVLGKRALGFYVIHLALIFGFWKIVLISVES